jgi:hypothetical protein
MRAAWRGAFVVAAAALGACHAPPAKTADQMAAGTQSASVCTLISYEDIARALGRAPVGATDTADNGALNPGCSWMGDTADSTKAPPMLVLTIWRKSALDLQGAPMSGEALYQDELGDITDEFGAAQPLYGAGDEGAIGMARDSAGALRAKIVIRKGKDVLTMQLTGADIATFEAIARTVARAM